MEESTELENYAMATLRQRDTGTAVMWMRPNYDATAERNKEPIVYVRTDGKDTGTGMDMHSVTFTVSDNPILIEPQDKSGKSLDQSTESAVIEFIKRNKDILLQFWNDELDSEDLREIFIRINSKGKVLTQADFVMSKIAANENYRGHELRKLIDYFCHLSTFPEDYDVISSQDKDFQNIAEIKKLSWLKYKQENLYEPEYTDVLRVAFISKFGRGRLRDLVALLSGRNFETRTYEEEVAEESFSTLWSGVQDVVSQINFARFIMIMRSTGIVSKTQIGSINVLNYSYIVYLLLKESKTPHALIEKYVKKAYVFNILNERFAGNPEGTFDYDIKRIKEQGFIEFFDNLENTMLGDTFWNIALPQKFNTPVSSSPFYRLYLSAQCSMNDKGFLSKAISMQDMVRHREDVHHIYPKNYLVNKGYPQNKYNQIANYALTESPINIKISDSNPTEYMSAIINQCATKELIHGSIDNLDDLRANFKMNCIPEYMIDGNIPDFEVFLKDRQQLMAMKIKQYYEAL